MNRAVVLIMAVAIASGLLGYAISRAMQPTPSTVVASPGAVQDNPLGQRLPEFEFASLTGELLGHEDYSGFALIINLWATWCAPCVEEMPLLDDMARELRPEGLRLLGVALDDPVKVAEFLEQLPVQYPIAVTDTMEGLRFSRALGNARGLLPYTVFVGRDGRIARIKMGQLGPEEARKFAGEIL